MSASTTLFACSLPSMGTAAWPTLVISNRSPAPTDSPTVCLMLRGPLAFFGTAALSGILFHTLFFSFNLSNTNLSSVSRLQPSSRWTNSSGYSQEESCPAPPPPSIEYLTVTADSAAPTVTVFKDPWAKSDDMTLEEIRVMVSKTKGLFVRDFSLGLGWNNVNRLLCR